jgi:lytic murein transglycosylase
MSVNASAQTTRASRPGSVLTRALYALALALSFSGALGVSSPASAVEAKFKPNPPNCQNTNGPFEKWLATFRQDAAKAGIKPQTLSSALDGITFAPDILRIDRGQSFFSQPFIDFQTKLATPGRVSSGQMQMKKHAGTFQRAEAQWAVPPSVITAFWALESDFGSGIGTKPVIRSLATLAWDCRRGQMFREELIAALKIIDRGDLTPADMISSWAGELGQTQMLPTHYLAHAVDFDGDGKANLFKSAPDIIASTSKFIASLGWKKGEPWLEEVRLPATMAWEQADIAVKHPRSHWAKAGITKANGQPLAADALPASLILLQGRGGPAFLAYPNFAIFTEWNQSLNYATTAAYLATRLDGAPPLNKGASPAVPLVPDQIKELQTLLNKAGYPGGEPDGRLGLGTRSAIRLAQVKLGLPADSYPTVDLIERLRVKR